MKDFGSELKWLGIDLDGIRATIVMPDKMLFLRTFVGGQEVLVVYKIIFALCIRGNEFVKPPILSSDCESLKYSCVMA